MLRRLLLSAAVAAAGLAANSVEAIAEDASTFPSRPITLIVPFQAGVSADLLFRGIAESASKHLGQPVIVDNKPGGSATLGPGHDGRQRQARRLHDRADRRSPCSASPTCRRRPSIRSRTSPTSSMLGGYSLRHRGQGRRTLQEMAGRHRLRQGQSRQVHLRDDRPGHDQLHIAMELMAAPVRRPVHARPDQGRRRSPSRPSSAATSWHGGSRRAGRRWSTAGQFRLLMMLDGERSKKWPDAPTLKELGYTYVFDSPVRPRRPQGHGPGRSSRSCTMPSRRPTRTRRSIELFDKFDFMPALHEHRGLRRLRAEDRCRARRRRWRSSAWPRRTDAQLAAGQASKPRKPNIAGG